MILVDVNLLVYATMADQPEHDAARSWLDDRLSGTARVGLPWESLVGFARLATNPRVFRNPLPPSEAAAQIRRWLSSAAAWVPAPTDRHAEVLTGLLAATPGMRSGLVHDAHLAAIALQHGLTLCSTDGDFARLAELRWQNPLAA